MDPTETAPAAEHAAPALAGRKGGAGRTVGRLYSVKSLPDGDATRFGAIGGTRQLGARGDVVKP